MGYTSIAPSTSFKVTRDYITACRKYWLVCNVNHINYQIEFDSIWWKTIHECICVLSGNHVLRTYRQRSFPTITPQHLSHSCSVGHRNPHCGIGRLSPNRRKNIFSFRVREGHTRNRNREFSSRLLLFFFLSPSSYPDAKKRISRVRVSRHIGTLAYDRIINTCIARRTNNVHIT